MRELTFLAKASPTKQRVSITGERLPKASHKESANANTASDNK